MDDPNITMEECVQNETEKDLINGKVYNWETATYGKIRYVEDINDLRFFETKFPAIVYEDALTSELEFSSEHTIFPVNDLKLDMGNGDDKIDIKQSSEDISIEPLRNVISIDVGTYEQRFRYSVSSNMDTAYRLPIQS
ncbi:hypothetical protein Tco_1155515 [Tanacetum coccineum]